jgi:hypothetical protein
MRYRRGTLLVSGFALAVPLALGACGGSSAEPAATATGTGTSAAAPSTSPGTGAPGAPATTGPGSSGAGTDGAPAPSGQDSAALTLVPGFPTALVPLPPGARVTSSAVQPSGALTQVSLTGTTSAEPKEIVAFYRDKLTSAKFTVAPEAVLPAGVTSMAFSRGKDEILVLAVASDGGTRSFSIGGAVRL